MLTIQQSVAMGTNNSITLTIFEVVFFENIMWVHRAKQERIWDAQALAVPGAHNQCWSPKLHDETKKNTCWWSEISFLERHTWDLRKTPHYRTMVKCDGWTVFLFSHEVAPHPAPRGNRGSANRGTI